MLRAVNLIDSTRQPHNAASDADRPVTTPDETFLDARRKKSMIITDHGFVLVPAAGLEPATP
jgi:hypothetical protein